MFSLDPQVLIVIAIVLVALVVGALLWKRSMAAEPEKSEPIDRETFKRKYATHLTFFSQMNPEATLGSLKAAWDLNSEYASSAARTLGSDAGGEFTGKVRRMGEQARDCNDLIRQLGADFKVKNL